MPRSTATARSKATPALPTVEWERVLGELDAVGHAVVPGLLDAEQCAQVAALYPAPDAFRSHIVMQRHGFGQGEYRYFAYPLPQLVARLRAAAYPPLARLANLWNEHLGVAGGKTPPPPALSGTGPRP